MKTKNRLIAMLLALIMVLSLMPMNVISSMAVSASDFTEPTIFVDSKYSAANSTVSVDVIVANNPGIAGATLTVSYDQYLTLTSAENGEAFSKLSFTKSGSLANPSKFLWDSESGEAKGDGTILTLTFDVSAYAQADANLNIEISSNLGDFYDEDMETVNLQLVSGSVTVIDYIPGDVNGDGVVNGKDVTLVRRHIVGGYDQTINAAAAEVNEDGVINGKDVTAIRRYIVGGYNIELKPSKPTCNHQLEATAYKAATCTEAGNIAYWQCSECNKYFKDAVGTIEVSLDNTVIPAKGHTVVIDPAVAPTDKEEGRTEGSHCSECGAVIVEPQPIPIPQKEQYNITYDVANGDLYLASLDIDNPNENFYYSEEGYDLKAPNVPGYKFLGWYDLPDGTNAEIIKTIPAESKKDYYLYAHWEKYTYTIHFDSPDVPVADILYTVDEGVPLINPAKQFGYSFVGWSNDEGFLVSRIKQGTTGSMTLHANWTSERNKATSYNTYNDPYIIEDTDNGQFLFVYDIGKIDNVPLSVIYDTVNSEGININDQYSVSNSVDSETAKTVAETVSNATTKSSAWTLSSDWNKLYSAGNEIDDTKGKTTVRTDSEGNVTGGNYFVSNSNGGSSYVSSSSGGSSSNSAKVTTAESVGINNSYDSQTQKYADAKLSINNTTEISAGVSFPVDIVKVNAGVKNTTSVGAEVSSGRKDNTAVHADNSYSGYVGTYNESNNSSYYDTTSRSESNWNSTSGYEKSYQTSVNTEISNAINEQITNKTTYSVQDAIGGSESKNVSDTTSATKGNEYVNSVRFNEQTKATETRTVKQSASASGYYRVVNAGTIHVFAVVGYDVATCSYYTYTYNVLDDERHTYLDFSLKDPNFKDCQNGVVNFEVPYSVNEYVCALTGKTDGLQISLDGVVTAYSGEDSTVVIPQYDSADNLDTTNSAIKVKSFNANVFKGNTNIKTVVLPLYVTEIPANAFEGCTDLETVYAFGVTKIGANAFKGCTKLKKFSVDNKITVLGENVFEDVPEVMVCAANIEVADNAINCGAKKITLNISKVDEKYSNQKIVVGSETDYFALYSDGSTVNNLQVASSAVETVINNIEFINNTDVPLTIDSNKVTLNRVKITSAPALAMILKSSNTELSLYSDVVIDSQRENAILCRDITLKNANPRVTCSLTVNNNILVCGDVNDSEDCIRKANIIKINEEDYNSYLSSCLVAFDANNGEVGENSRNVRYGQTYGTLPVPTREGYTFDGWYTDKNEGNKVTENSVVTSLTSHTLYAHWLVNEFTATWSGGTGYTIVVNRTSSPNKGASTGVINSGAKVYYGDVLSINYTKADYYTLTSTGKTSITVSRNITSSDIYATASLNSTSGWVLASNVPSGAQIVNTKWAYNLRSYTSSSSSSLSGWTKYDTKRTSWGATQGPVYSDPSNGARNVWSEQYVTSSNYKTVYKYYRYAVNYTGGYGSYAQSNTYPNYHVYTFDSPLPADGTSGGHTKYRYWYNSSNWISVYDQWTEQQWVSDNYGTRWYYQDPVYTYYFYKDETKETTSGDPTGQTNVSNVVKYVKYRAK